MDDEHTAQHYKLNTRKREDRKRQKKREREGIQNEHACRGAGDPLIRKRV